METKTPDLMKYCSHSRSSEEEGAAQGWGCIQEVVAKRIQGGRRDTISSIKIHFFRLRVHHSPQEVLRSDHSACFTKKENAE